MEYHVLRIWMISILSKKLGVEKVISFFDFNTIVSIMFFLGFFWRKMVPQNLVNPYHSFRKGLNAKWHNASRGLFKKKKPLL
jgi:hypothetical protein